MADSENDILFETVDPKGYPVVLSSGQYYGHIISSDPKHQAHPEFTPDEAKRTIEDPIFICGGNQPNSDIYISKKCSLYPQMYLKIAVSTFVDCGDVRTGYIDPDPFSGTNGEIKYANYKSELR